jgi:PIN domain nuclease of toxin-antitoxin system
VVSAIEAGGMQAIPITAADAEAAGRLPPHHRDPFDRMLVAQARRLDAIIVSRDGSFAAYGADTLTA